MNNITISVNNEKFEVELYDNSAAETLLDYLPMKLSMTAWGDEFYGSITGDLPVGDELRDIYEIGEVAYWPPGNAFCIFFGVTPVSTDSRPRMASAGVPIGIIVEGNIERFKTFKGEISIDLSQ